MAIESQILLSGQDCGTELQPVARGTFSVRWPPPEPAGASTAIYRSTGREIETDDWDSLFGAIEDTLRDSVAGLPTPAQSLLSIENEPRNLRAIVLDCVTSLEYLHAALKKGRRQQNAHLTNLRDLSERAAAALEGGTEFDPGATMKIYSDSNTAQPSGNSGFNR